MIRLKLVVGEIKDSTYDKMAKVKRNWNEEGKNGNSGGNIFWQFWAWLKRGGWLQLGGRRRWGLEPRGSGERMASCGSFWWELPHLRSASLHGLHLYKFSSSFFFLNLLIPFRNEPSNEDFVIYVIIIQQL